MGLGGISLTELLIVLVIVVLIFGTKRLKTIGSDLGGAIKGFRSGMNTEDAKADKPAEEAPKPLTSSEPDAEFPEQKQKSRQA